jgi:hypothetical protein
VDFAEAAGTGFRERLEASEWRVDGSRVAGAAAGLTCARLIMKQPIPI